MTILQALTSALTLLEALGYREGGDIHDDLEAAILRLQRVYPEIAGKEL